MKVFSTIMKLLTALATLAGIVYIIATYGEQIVAWAKKALASLPKCPCCEDDEVVVEVETAAEEEPAAEEVPLAEEEAAEEPAPEIVVEAHEPVAEENDFAE